MAEELRDRVAQKTVAAGPNDFRCADCGFASAYKHVITNHIEAKHESIYYNCFKCGKDFNSQQALKMHDRRSHKQQF